MSTSTMWSRPTTAAAARGWRCPTVDTGSSASDEPGLAIEDSLWVDGGGQPRQTQQLVVTGDVGREGDMVHWTLRKLG